MAFHGKESTTITPMIKARRNLVMGKRKLVLEGRSKSKNQPKIKHEERRKEVLEILEPIFAREKMDVASVLLCWGRADHCQTVLVEIPHSAEGVTLWHEIQQTWHKEKGSRRRIIPFFGANEVSVVEVSGLNSVNETIENTDRQASSFQSHVVIPNSFQISNTLVVT